MMVSMFCRLEKKIIEKELYLNKDSHKADIGQKTTMDGETS